MIHRLSIAVLLALVTLAAPPLEAQPVRLIEDVRPGALGCFQRDDGAFLWWDLPAPVVAGELLFFACNDGTHGVELWRSDGTAEGTFLAKDVRAGSLGCFQRDDGTLNEFIEPAVIGGLLFFTCDDGVHGIELWKSDGTVAGTQLVRDIFPGPGSAFPESKSDPTWFYHDLVPVGEAVFFVADDGEHGYELWKSDGTEGGTVLVADIRPELDHGSVPMWLTGIGGILYFAPGIEPVHGTEPWRSDGTAAGTFMLADARPGSAGSEPTKFTPYGGSVLFQADDGAHGAEPWITDGAQAGTRLVADICPGTCSSYPDLKWAAVVGPDIYFPAYHASYGWELWKSDGTDLGTAIVKDIWTGDNWQGPTQLTPFDGGLIFAATEGSGNFSDGRDLWRTDGTEAGTVRLETGNLDPGWLTAMGDVLFFTVDDGAFTSELWKTDGTQNGAVRVKDVYPDDYPDDVVAWASDLTPLGDLLYFTQNDGDHGEELWRTNGEAAGTVLIADIFAGLDSSSPRWLRPAGDDLFFVADDGVHGFEPWILPRSVTLHDQTGGAASSGQASQEFEPADSSYDCLAADDFVVPAADRQWDLGEVVVGGAYDIGGGPTPFLNLEVYADSSGLPGATVCSYDGLGAGVDFTDHGGDLKIVLPTPCTLPSGTYWLMVQADMDYAIGSQWWWTQQTLQWLTPYRWINPEDGFATGCTTWTAGCGGSEPDLAFALRTSPGCALGASELVLSGETLAGIERIEACRTITAGGGTAVTTGSDVTLRAGRRIVLESGFSVGSGASLELQIDPGLATPDP